MDGKLYFSFTFWLIGFFRLYREFSRMRSWVYVPLKSSSKNLTHVDFGNTNSMCT